MKLHQVELENWRQHSKTQIDFDEGATVIYGPNETGKSTILEALSRGLFDKSGSHARVIKRIIPHTATGNVSTIVRFELTLNNIRYRVEKIFNLKNGTFLFKYDGGKPVLLSQDDSADEELIQLLEADLPSTQGSKTSQWGAFQWLWAPQDHRELPNNKEGDPTKSLHLENKDTGGVLVTPRFQSVMNSVDSNWLEYFTKKGKVSKNSPILKIENEIETHDQKREELKGKIKNVDDKKQQLEELQQGLPSLKDEIKKTEDELNRAKSEEIDITSMESELKAINVTVEGTERDVDEAKKGIKELKKSAELIEELQNKENETRTKNSQLEALCEQLEKQQQKIKEDVEEKAMKVRDSEELTKDSRILYTKFDTKNKIETFEEKINRIKNIEKEIDKLRKKTVPLIPTQEELNELLQSQTRIEVLKENLKSKGLMVNVIPGKKGALDVEVDGKRIEKIDQDITGTEEVSIGSKGLGKVTVKAKLEQAQDAKVDIERLEENAQETLVKFKVKSIDEFKKLTNSQNQLLIKINEFIFERKGIDEKSIDDINLELNDLKEKFEEYNKIKRTDFAKKMNPIDGDLGKLIKKREKEETDTRTILDQARDERDKFDKGLSRKREELTKSRAELKHISDDLVNSRKHEREIIQQYGSIQHQEKLLKSSEKELETRKKDQEEKQTKYEELQKGPMRRIERLEQQLETQKQIFSQQQTNIDQLRGGIATESLEGTYSELSEIESHIEILNGRLNREQIVAESYQLLKETLENQYRTALSVVVGPIQNDVKRSLGYVTGFLHEDVELDEYLFPIRLGERGIDDISLEFDDGSSGLKEILTLCVRLAVAKHLSESDSQCLILDDPFVHVSSDRSNKMIELINNAIKENNLQVIVFTHRPMEFAGFSGKAIDILNVKQ